ncbi:MBL fold metallo-hydrolase RNA specificity domain-containing protein [Bryobacter aggregatus]|uniref:MBL fold metallo-hydrolase RNA specificity domain-containing protein n=1 Tax=Bryobacter aggregatus TaxID=360054 RepID=UPI0004E0CA22|nr:MBL fold metallo-hydrolase [Bryobacter aggregatus]
MEIHFWGATRTVTGSMHEIQHAGKRLLLDCGLFQGRRSEARDRNCCFPFSASAVDQVVLSHAHIDHSGNLPNLVKQGFRGPIHATAATQDLCRAMLADSAYLQERDADFLNRRRDRRKRLMPNYQEQLVEPLYTSVDAENTFPLFAPLPMNGSLDLGDGLTVETVEAGHMLGSVCMRLTDGKVRLGFSGDIGRKNLPIIRDPQEMLACDYLIMESTYGDRFHQDEGAVLDKLADVVNRTAARGGKIVVPSFAVGRTQQLVLLLNQLAQADRIPNIPIFVDSPLAVNVTQTFRKFSNLFDAETAKMLAGDAKGDVFGFSRLRYIKDVADSKALNDIRGPFIVISASGMCEAGRVVHHLRNTIADPRNTVLITGFQAENTLGRKILDKWPEVPIFGDMIRLRAEVAKINELSGHADQRELLEWLQPIAKGLKKIFLVHGESKQQEVLQKVIQEAYGVEVVIANRGNIFRLD